MVSGSYQLPGHYLAERLSATDLYVEVPVQSPPKPITPADVHGLLNVACAASRLDWSPDFYARARAQAPEATFYSCRFRFAKSHSELFGAESQFRALLRRGLFPEWLLGTVPPPSMGLDVSAVIAASLGPALASDASAITGWTTREVIWGSEKLSRAIPSAISLLLVLCAAFGLRLGLWADLHRTWANRRDLNNWRLLALFFVPAFAPLPIIALSRWLGEDALPKLLSIGLHRPLAGIDLSDVFAAVISAPIAEELVYRAWMIPFLSRGMSPHLAIACSSALFAYGHGHSFLEFMASGLAFGYLWQYRRSATLCIASHMYVNALVTVTLALRENVSALAVGL